MPQAVIFDVDGTLVDSVDLHARAWQDAFLHFGKQVPLADVRYQIGKGGDQLMPVFWTRREIDRIGGEMHAYRTRVYLATYRHQVRAFPKVRELFDRIKRDGHRIALASSADAEDFQHNLQLLDIGGLVDATTTARDAARSKPHPDIFEAALARLGGLHPAHAVAVGDTPYDGQAATQIALPIAGLLCGGFPESDLRTSGCIEIWRDPAHLLDCYEETLLHRG